MLPYGEWILFSLAFGFWAEKIPGQRLLMFLAAGWLGGRAMEVFFTPYAPWNWHYARLAVIFLFWIIAWRQAKRRMLPLFLVVVALISQDLFIVNEPGIFFADQWLFAGVVVLAALISTHGYWDLAAAISGGLLLNQVIFVFLFDGVLRLAELPNDFTWNFWVVFFALGGLVRAWKQARAALPAQESGVRSQESGVKPEQRFQK